MIQGCSYGLGQCMNILVQGKIKWNEIEFYPEKSSHRNEKRHKPKGCQWIIKKTNHSQLENFVCVWTTQQGVLTHYRGKGSVNNYSRETLYVYCALFTLLLITPQQTILTLNLLEAMRPFSSCMVCLILFYFPLCR